MQKINTKTFLLIAGLTVCGVATAGGRGSSTPTPLIPPPMIVKTSVDTQGKTLIISGRNFGTTTPSVMLADQVLEVKRFSGNEVVANLPHGLAPANYGVSVTTSGKNRASSNLFSAALPPAFR